MNNNTLGYVASVFSGFGLAELQFDFNRALISFGIAVALIITVAVLNRFGVPVSSNKAKVDPMNRGGGAGGGGR